MEQDNSHTDRHSTLRQALTPTEQRRLPSNFAYNALRRIEQQQREAERRQHVWAAFVVLFVSALGICALIYYIGAELRKLLSTILLSPSLPPFVLPTLFCCTFFAILNHWLAHKANKEL